MFRPRHLVSALAAVALVASVASSPVGAATKKTTKKTTKKPAVATTTAAPPSTAAPVAAPAAGVAAVASRPLPADGDKNGTLKLGYDFVSQAGFQLDPTKISQSTAIAPIVQIFDTLLRYDTEKSSFSPGLASAAKIIDEKTISVTLRPNLKFQNGEPLDAEAVKFSIERNIKSPSANVRFNVAELSGYDTIEVKSPTQFNIKLKTPTSGSFFPMLAFQDTLPVPPKATAAGADFLKPGSDLGSGAFKLTDYTAGEKAVFTKWDGFWDADNVRVAKVEWRHVLGTDATTLALRSENVDAAGRVTLEQYRQFQKSNLIVKEFTNPDATYTASIRCVGTFADVKVRQSLMYAIDTFSISQAIFGPSGQRQIDFFPSGPNHNSTLDSLYRKDVDKAKQLISAAGKGGLVVRIGVVAGQARDETVAALIHQQLKVAGFNPEIVTSTSILDFVLRGAADIYFTPAARIWTDKALLFLNTPGTLASCLPVKDGVADFEPKIAKLRTIDPDSPEVPELWKSIQKTVIEGVYTMPLAIGPEFLVWNKRLGDVAWRADKLGSQWYPDVYKVYIKK